MKTGSCLFNSISNVEHAMLDREGVARLNGLFQVKGQGVYVNWNRMEWKGR